MAHDNEEIRSETPDDNIFEIKDCALIAIATGESAVTLKEFFNIINKITPASIYHHFWGGLLLPRFEEREFNNDFASWAKRELDDDKLAEQLALISPTDFPDLESLRREIIDVVMERMNEASCLSWFPASSALEFIRSRIVVFDTHVRVAEPRELGEIIPDLSPSTIFYHFIDARRRVAEGKDDFRAWLENWEECSGLCEKLADLDPYFDTLNKLRSRIAAVFAEFFQGG
ncbi:MAG: DUF5752 family protein [Thermodesulfobacteriota bacterium]